MSQGQLTPKAVTKWGALGYQQVPGLANRLISRYLRAQRRNMRRFFLERGFLDLAERMRQIKLSRQGMMAKNRMFQEVLDSYAKRTTPQPVTEASHPALPVAASMAVQPSVTEDTQNGDSDSGDRGDSSGSVRAVEKSDSDGIVIEE